MNREILKRCLLVVVVLFTLTLAAPLILLKGFNRDSLERKSAEIAASLRQYLQAQNDVLAFITSDNVVRSGPMQFVLGNGLGLLQKHLNGLNDNFGDLRLVSLYDKSGQLFLSTDYELAAGSLDSASILDLKDRKYGIYYVPDYNQYALSVIAPLMNQFNFRIGYVRCLFTLKSFLAKLKLGRDFRLFLASDGGIASLSPDVPTAGLEFSDGVRTLKQAGTLWMSKSPVPEPGGIRFLLLYRYYNGLFILILCVNAFLAVLLAGLVTALLSGVRRAVADREFKKTADEVLTYIEDDPLLQGILPDVVDLAEVKGW